MDAIQKDVSPEEQGGQQVNPRHSVLEEIAGLVAEERVTQGAELEEETEQEVEQPEEQPQAAADDPEYEVKVDGQVQKVPLSKILDAGVRTYQKESTADKRLEEASRLKQEAERYAQWLATQQRAQAPPQPQALDPQQTFKTKLKAIGDAIQFGDEDTRDKALAEYGQYMAAMGAQMALPRIQQEVSAVELRRHNERVVAAFAAPPEQGGYGDIAADEELYKLSVDLVDAKRAQGDQRMDWGFYKEIGDTVRAMRSRLSGSTPPAPGLNADARRDMKRKIEAVPSMTGRATIPQEKEPTREDIIAEMRGKRAG